MSGRLITIRTNGTIEAQPIKAEPSTEMLHEIVGGWLEIVPGLTEYEGEPCVAFCNEEGKLKELPINVEATVLWHKIIRDYTMTMLAQIQADDRIYDYLSGNVVIVAGKDIVKAMMEDSD